jgi:beta-glucosidase/6-phospho-beta-glucosidase/beta-galactosidase
MYGPGLRDLILYTKDRYNGLETWVTENGLAWQEDNVTVAVNDVQRQHYLHDHIEAVGQAIAKGANMKGYFVWSFQVRYYCLVSLYCNFTLLFLFLFYTGQFGMGIRISNAFWFNMD